MPKRFTDSNKWQDEWFMELPAKYKLFYLYILDNCDHAGIWKVNLKLASFYIDSDLNLDEIREIFAGRIYEFREGYFFILKFIQFQYGGLKNDKVGKSVYKLLETNNLLGANEDLPSPLLGAKVKYKVKDIVKDKELEGGVGGDFNWESVKTYFLNADPWMYKFCSSKAVSRETLVLRMNEFLNDIELRNEYKPLKDLQSHFTNWFNKSEKQKKNAKPNKNSGRDELLESLRQKHAGNNLG